MASWASSIPLAAPPATIRTMTTYAPFRSAPLIVGLFFFLTLPRAIAAEKRGMIPEDVMRLKVISALEVAPDGSRIVYGIEVSDREKKGYTHALFEMDPGGGAPRPLTDPRDDCHSPRFSPDGRHLAYLCSLAGGKGADASAQAYVAKAGRRRARRVTRFAEGVDGLAWSPDGASLVVLRKDPAARAAGSPSGKKPAKSSEDDEPDPIVITRTQIQADGEGFLGERRTHLWIVPLDRSEPRRITSGPYDDSSPAWSPDGRWIAFVSNRTKDPDTNDNTDIFAVHPDGTGLRTLAANPGPDGTPVWSHKGDRLAFVGQLRPNDYYQITRLMVIDASSGAPTDLTGSLDAWVSADALLVSSGAYQPAQWSSDDTTIYVTIDRRGANYLAKVSSAGGPPQEILGGSDLLGQVRLSHHPCLIVRSSWLFTSESEAIPPMRHFTRSPGICDSLYFTRTDATHLPEIHTARLDGTVVRRLSHINDDFLAERKLSSPQKIVARSSGVTQVESWLYPPLDFDASRRYPLIVYLHGGPQGFDGDWFDTGLENQIFPAAGYAVLRVNYRGSTSYGEAFCRALWGDWHWREHDDIMASVDEALKLPWLDGARLGIGGWSYGGIMTVWVAGHTDRFKVGVPERFEIDYLSCFGEDQWFAQYLEEYGSPLEHADAFRHVSPGTYVPAIKTPLYLISDEKDGNCPLPQAMQLYQRLKLMGVPTELVVYPREPHVMAEPGHLVDRLHRLLRWFAAALK